MPLASHELPHVLRARVAQEKLRPVDHEAVGQEVHDAPAEAQRLDAAEALAEHGAGARGAEPEEAQGGRRDAHRNTRPCLSCHVVSCHVTTEATWFVGGGGGQRSEIGDRRSEVGGRAYVAPEAYDENLIM